MADEMRAGSEPAGGERAEGVHEDMAEVVITSGAIQARVTELAAEISRDYAGRDLVLVSVLKGAIYFLADLSRSLEIPHALDFMAISSFIPLGRTEPGHPPGAPPPPQTPGVVRILKDLDLDILDRDVLMVEDVVDTGMTLRYLLKTLANRRPMSLEVCVLLDRPEQRIAPLDIKYRGFDVGDRFVVGYGLDHREHYRHLPYIGVLKPEVMQAARG